jgi:glycosyltransferase involved in cell wall biosynthesis
MEAPLFGRMPLRLDLVVPTYNRHRLLGELLTSILEARIPDRLDATVVIVDNNSKDATRETVERAMPAFSGRLRYLRENRQGRSWALNAGINSTTGDLIGFVDDDERLDRQWFERVETAFRDPALDFIGGPYIPDWSQEAPPWLPREYPAVIGWIEASETSLPYDATFPGSLMGGNAVLRRKVFEKAGLYATHLGRTDKGLLSCEDDDMYRRILAAGFRGMYLPDLIIYHYVPAERLQKQYYRSWAFWRAISIAQQQRDRREPVPYLMGIPRYYFGNAVRGALARVKGWFGHPPDRSFAGELDLITTIGLLYGKYWYRPAPAESEVT